MISDILTTPPCVLNCIVVSPRLVQATGPTQLSQKTQMSPQGKYRGMFWNTCWDPFSEPKTPLTPRMKQAVRYSSCLLLQSNNINKFLFLRLKKKKRFREAERDKNVGKDSGDRFIKTSLNNQELDLNVSIADFFKHWASEDLGY